MPEVNKSVLNRDGSLNVTRKGYRTSFLSDLYYYLLSLSWFSFFVFMVSLYLILNLIFALCYFACGPEGLKGIESAGLSFFWQCFFFSIQTIATIGYGHIHPFGLIPNLIVTLESFIGILGLAILTGLFFSRFSKPTARVVFSHPALIASDHGVPCLMFRLANERKSQILEARLNVVLISNEITEEGVRYRRLHDLKLERSFSPIFTLSWTIIHVIDASSPLHDIDEKKWREQDIEILVALTGNDEVFGQPVHDRHAYRLEDIVWRGRFQDMLRRTPHGLEMDLAKIHSIET